MEKGSMSKVLRFKRPRRRRNDEEARVKRLRIVASRLGYELVSPWCAQQRHIPRSRDRIAGGKRALLDLPPHSCSLIFARLHGIHAVQASAADRNIVTWRKKSSG